MWWDKRLDTWLYVIRSAAGPVKVGISSDVDKRLRQLQTGQPFGMTVQGTAGPMSRDMAVRVEGCVHTLLGERRCRGEWFDATIDHVCEALARAAESVGEAFIDGRNEPAVHPLHC
jgi:hypothetical protein